VALVEENGRIVERGAHATGAAWAGDAPVFALGDGTVRIVGDTAEEVTQAHDGACLALALESDGRSVVTGGDDGRLVRTRPSAGASPIAEMPGKWIDRVAAGPSGALAWASGRRALARAGGTERVFEAPSGIGGLAFAPKGLRVALAHYGGATLHWLGAGGEPLLLPWKGSHGLVTFSPDGRFLVTAMQENALHGWRLAERQDMRMGGYPAKIRSMSWSAKGRWLATSGAEAAILWPFQGKDGPMGKSARELGVRPQISTCVACHPKLDVVAVGYQDGLVMLIRIEDGAEVVAAKPGGGAVTALAWAASGDRLAFGTEEGRLGVMQT